MAKFEMIMPDEIMKGLEEINNGCKDVFGEMTRAGAEVAYKNVLSNMPESFKNSDIRNCLKMTRTYDTPTDDGINTKVGFYGYFESKKKTKDGKNVIVPAPLVANVFEYGSTKFKKKPFFRKSFKKAQIEKAMLEVQSKAFGGLLDE